MDRGQWSRAVQLFEELLAVPESDRDLHLAQAPADDQIKAVVARMLASDAGTGWILDLEGGVMGALSDDVLTELAPGTAVGGYVIEGEVGRGAMGVVYQALDPRLGRRAALKFVSSSTVSGREQLIDEARAASLLDHSNIATVYHIGETSDGDVFIAFPYYEGGSLADRLERAGPMEPTAALELVSGVARGLAAAHEAGLVHRDVKPSNIALTDDGTAKLLDFGIAVTQGVEDAPAGTPRYMSPEQAAGHAPDPSSDVWGLGMVMLEVLLGSDATVGGVPSALDGVPDRLRPILTRALATRANDRYPDAGALSADLEALQSAPGRRSNRWTRVAGTALAASVVAGLWVSIPGAPELGPSALDPGSVPHSIAVLPFEDAGSDTDAAHLASGLPEEVLTALARLPSLKVVSGLSSFAAAAGDEDLTTVARRLDVTTMLTGTVRLTGDSLKVSTRLIEAATGEVLWSETYERGPDDVSNVQEDIARSVVQTLGIDLGGTGSAGFASVGTTSPLAHQLYLRGRALWQERGTGLARAELLLERAVEEDSSYAAAWAALADARALMPLYLGTDRDQARPRAEAAARMALSLDPELPMAHTAWGNIRKDFYADWQGAEASLRRAVSLSPSDATAHQWLAEAIQAQGRLEESYDLFHRAAELDPLSPTAQISVALTARFMGRLEEARARLDTLSVEAPDFPLTHFWQSLTNAALDDYEGALESLTYLTESVVGGDPGEAAPVLESVRLQMPLPAAVEAVRAWEGHPLARFFAPYFLAAMGAYQEAFDMIERTTADGQALVFLWDPAFDPVRSHPRFQALAMELNMPAAAQ